LDTDTLVKERFLDKHITRAKVVQEIGEDIIDFLSQIEDFQKKLWEKKKFVLKTEYVITTDRMPEEFYHEILENKEQKREWDELGFEIPKVKEELKDKKLPIDTKHFSIEFKEKLLEKLTEKADLDDLLDGWLIKSENYQALNTLLPKFKEKVQTIYIDPPFNKDQNADYLYNVKYKDSTWITMLENRLRLAKEILSDSGSIFVRCDYNGNMYVRLLMNEIFGEDNFRNEIIIRKGKRTESKERNKFENDTESILFYASNKEKTLIKIPLKEKPKEELEWTTMFFPEERGDPYRIFYGIKIKAPKNTHWQFSQERINDEIEKGNIRIICNNCGYIHEGGSNISKCPKCSSSDFSAQYMRREIPVNNDWTDILGYTYIVSKSTGFQTENSEILLKRVIESTSSENDLIMDFFLGSGTTTAAAHKLKRKWIGIEMGEHFWTVILPRMKKVLAYDKSGISKEEDVRERYNKKTAGGFFKYQILEQYEDTLDNIELQENQSVKKLFKDQYLLKYFLDYETKESPCLLNIDHLKNPFVYKLKVNLEEVGAPQEMLVDIPETFNYLLGLKIKKIKTRENGRKYLFILGEKEGKDYAIVWREYNDKWSDEDFKKDKEFIIQELEDWTPHVVYINGQSALTPKNFEIRLIEPEFTRLMGGFSDN